jgi:hypothetical protein
MQVRGFGMAELAAQDEVQGLGWLFELLEDVLAGASWPLPQVISFS